MATEAVVIGGGPGGLRAAVALRRAGRSVVLLQIGPHAGGNAHPDVPVGRGLTTAPGRLAEALYGEFRDVPGLERAVERHGRVVRLPLSRPQLAALLPKRQVLPAAAAWARARGAVELKKVVGGGSEQRTYRDWVVQRFGEPVYERLFAPYAARRFGDPAALSCNVARLFHGVPAPDVLQAPGAGPALPSTDVDVRLGVTVTGVADGRVTTDRGVFEGDVFVDAPPSVVVGWLPAATATSLRSDAEALVARDAVQVLVRGGEELPFETHVLDEDVPFYRMVRPGLLPGCEGLTGTVCAHFAVDPEDRSPDEAWVSRAVEGLKRAGVRDADGAGARVQRIPWQHPVWTGTHLSRMRRYALALEELDVVPVGRGGLHGQVDLAAELAWLDGALAEDAEPARERMRRLVEPPVTDPSVRARLTHFVER